MTFELAVGNMDFGLSINKKPYSHICMQTEGRTVEQRIYFGMTNLLTEYAPEKKAYLLSFHLFWFHFYIGGI